MTRPGSGQVAAAFGCAMFQPENNLPCAGSHVLKQAEDVFAMPLPDVAAGW